MKKLSVIIPVKNGAQTLDICLSKIKSQTLNDLEIIILDSGSTDNSKEIAVKYNAKIIDIPLCNFNHGLTRNIGVQNASSDFIYLTVQDAWIEDAHMLENMLSHFKYELLQSVTGMQAIPHETDKNPALWFKRSSKPFTNTINFEAGEFAKLGGAEQIKFCRWDNVNTMYRKKALLMQPFVETNLSEDIIWAKQALEKGWKIMNDPGLVVYHYHHHTLSYNFKVNYSVFYANRKIFSVLPKYPNILLPLLRRIKTIILNSRISIFSKPKWILHNVGILLSQAFAVFVFKVVIFWGGQQLLNKSLKYFCKQIPQGKLA